MREWIDGRVARISRCQWAWAVCAAVCAANVGLPRAAVAEQIQDFDVDVRLLKDTSLDVTETIHMDFGYTSRHGIYRRIPVRYERNANPYTISLNILSVTDDSGNSVHYEAARQGPDINLRIGDASQKVIGTHVYRIHYLVRRAVNFFDKAPEVYWNTTGNDWPYPIVHVSTRFYPPAGTTIADLRADSFAGPLGSTDHGQVERRDDYLLFQTGALMPGSGQTIVVGLPAGSVTPPSAWQEFLWWFRDWWPAIVLPAVGLGLIGGQWWRAGRDVGVGQAIPVEWNPPENLAPAEVGTLIDERCDMADIVSTLIDLAARGYLTIKERHGDKFFFFSSHDYQFVRKDPPAGAAPLLPYEREFLEGIFPSGNVSYLSDLKDRFYVHLSSIKDQIYRSLTSKKFFTANPDTVRAVYYGIGIFLTVGGVILAFIGFASGHVAWGLGMAGAGVIVYAFARAMPAKTALGTHTLRECQGFQRFLALVEKDRIAMMAKEDPTIFGRLLPYAMVLGVADRWAATFKDLLTQPPDWYVPLNNTGFNSYFFVNDLGRGMHQMGQTFSSRPSSSGSGGGGSSGFSGGSSGGGFGGGGGGSW